MNLWTKLVKVYFNVVHFQSPELIALPYFIRDVMIGTCISKISTLCEENTEAKINSFLMALFNIPVVSTTKLSFLKCNRANAITHLGERERPTRQRRNPSTDSINFPKVVRPHISFRSFASCGHFSFNSFNWENLL